MASAVAIADRSGLAALTMRSLADELGVKPMSLYHHVAGKEEILDGIVDAVFGEIDLPAAGGDWWEELRRRAWSARTVLGRHQWAIALMETRTSPGPETLAHHDAVIGTLRSAGFSPAAAARAYAVLDAYVYGFALQEAMLPLGSAEDVADLADSIMADFAADAYPNLAWMAVEHVMRPGYDFGAQFEFGLELILDGLRSRSE